MDMISRKERERINAEHNQRVTEQIRAQVAARKQEQDNVQIPAKTYYVWTMQAQHEDKSGTIRAGKQARAEYLYSAPKWVLDRGLIIDASKSTVKVEDGQTDLIEY